jgi:hypothetical protein
VLRRRGRCALPAVSLADWWAGAARGDGQKGTRRGDGSVPGVHESWAGPEVTGQVEGGMADSERVRQACARQVFDAASAYRTGSIEARRNKTKTRVICASIWEERGG